MRTTNVELPSVQELFAILAGESQRKAVKFDFLDQNPTLYKAYKQLSHVIGDEAEWIDQFAVMPIDTLVKRINETTQKMTDCIRNNACNVDIRNELYDRLAYCDTPVKCDALFVFGSPADIRIAKAVELYHAKIAPKLIVSGKGPHYKFSDYSEAVRMAQYAIDNGVPESAIIIEDQSISLPDNVKRTLDLFEALRYKPKSIGIVATTYIMRRAMMEWYKFCSWNIAIIAIDTIGASEVMLKTSWYKSERGTRMLLNEYAKIVLEHKMDLERENGV